MGASERFERYMEHLAAGLGHADRHAGLTGYCTGLMLPEPRKSVEPMAAGVDPLHGSARHQTGVPAEVQFATKTEIALAQLQALLAEGAPRHCVLADAGYGVDAAFRARLSDLGLPYAVGITSSVVVRPPGLEPLPPKRYGGTGRPPVMPRRTRRRPHRWRQKELHRPPNACPSRRLRPAWQPGARSGTRPTPSRRSVISSASGSSIASATVRTAVREAKGSFCDTVKLAQ
jgi:SRSO17 transposase